MDEGEKGGIPDAVEVEEMDEEVKGIDEDGGEIDQVLVLVVYMACIIVRDVRCCPCCAGR